MSGRRREPGSIERTDPVEAAAHAALDAGRDPLADEAVLAALVDAPEAFEHVARLASDAAALARLETAVPVVSPRPRVRRVAASLAAAALLLVALGIGLAQRPDRPAPPGERPEPDLARATDSTTAAAPGAVESFTLTLTSGPPQARQTLALSRPAGSSHTTLTRTVRGLSPTGDTVLLTSQERLP